jgi:hypothetical protein
VIFKIVVNDAELSQSIQNEQSVTEKNQRILSASLFANKLFKCGVIGGTVALSTADIKLLMSHMNIHQNDIFWEIGCGHPKLAFSLSAASMGGMVICTDIRKMFITIQLFLT